MVRLVATPALYRWAKRLPMGIFQRQRFCELLQDHSSSLCQLFCLFHLQSFIHCLPRSLLHQSSDDSLSCNIPTIPSRLISRTRVLLNGVPWIHKCYLPFITTARQIIKKNTCFDLVLFNTLPQTFWMSNLLLSKTDLTPSVWLFLGRPLPPPSW